MVDGREVEGMGWVGIEVGVEEGGCGSEAYECGRWGEAAWPQIVEEGA